jgi:hypothetical protein
VTQPGFDPSTPPPPPEQQNESDPAPVATPAQPPPARTRPVEPPPVYQPPVDTPPEPEPTAEPEPAGPSKGELWSQAYRLKEQKKFHSLREVLDRLMAVDPDYAEVRDWRREVDEWAADREKDLKGETEDLLEEVIDALGDRDAEHLAEQWGGKLDVGTEAFAQEMWDLSPRLRWTARLRTFKARDDRATFVALIAVTDYKNKKLREVAWNGSMVEDSDGARLTSPLR